MKERAVQTIKNALEQAARPRSLDELKAEGQSHVRVVTKADFLAMVQSIVDQAIADGQREFSQQERVRLAEDVRQRLGMVARVKADAEQALRQRDGEIKAVRNRAEAAEQRVRDLQARLDEAERRQARSDEEFRRLLTAAQTDADGDEGALQRRLDSLESMVRGLAEQERGVRDDFDARLESSLERTLKAVDKTIRAATAKPVQGPAVQATDPLLSRIFDDEAPAESNLDQLGADEQRSTRRVTDAVERLRQARRRKDQD